MDRLNFQVKLYETTNIIEFVYGPATGNTNSDELAAIGIKNTVNGKIVFINISNSALGLNCVRIDRIARNEFAVSFDGFIKFTQHHLLNIANFK